MNDKDTPRIAWNLHMVSPSDQSTVIKEMIVKGIQKSAMRISETAKLITKALVMVRSRGFRHTTAKTREFPMTDPSITARQKMDFSAITAIALVSISSDTDRNGEVHELQRKSA